MEGGGDVDVIVPFLVHPGGGISTVEAAEKYDEVFVVGQ